MYVIAIAARKGGVGKTTVAVHLAVAAQRADQRTLLIDLDPQRSATAWAETRGEDPPDVVSASSAQLHDLLNAVRADTDIVIIDTPPSAGDAGRTAIAAADLVIVPTRLAASDLRGVISSYDEAVGRERPAFVLANGVDGRRPPSHVDDMRKQMQVHQIAMAPIVIHLRLGISDAQDVGRTIIETASAGPAASEFKALHLWAMKQLKSKSSKK